MILTNTPIYLASNSPRRIEMLKMLGIPFKKLSVQFEEVIDHEQSPIKNVKRISLQKCELAKKKIKDGIIITADTIVVLEGRIIGKPKNKKDAKIILSTLSGRHHYVFTGYTLVNLSNNKSINDYSKTTVFFKKLTENEISNYVAGGSPMDKAGAYGIQDDFGAVFVEKIVGCYYNVIGFPVSKIYQGLKTIL